MTRPIHSSLNAPPLRISAVGDLYTVLVSGDQTGGRYTVIHAVVPPGGGPPPHKHSREDEGFYVLAGELTFTADGTTTKAGPGTFINLPIGSLHFFKNDSPAPAEMLITCAPSGFEKYLEECGTVLKDSQSGPLLVTPEDIARLLGGAAKYGIEIHAKH